jgi:DNA-binding response OmpR family regulator
MHILLVDDDKGSRESLIKLFARHGHLVSDAADGDIALKMLAEFKPDLLITDLLMPHMDGIAFIAKAKDAKLLNCPLMVISAYYPEGARVSDAAYVMHKPVDPDALLQRIDAIARGATVR